MAEIAWRDRLEALPCKGKHATSVIADGTCEHCRPLYEEAYPQGWSYYPGDVCEHGTYVGGCGEDLMCARCELGEPGLTACWCCDQPKPKYDSGLCEECWTWAQKWMMPEASEDQIKRIYAGSKGKQAFAGVGVNFALVQGHLTNDEARALCHWPIASVDHEAIDGARVTIIRRDTAACPACNGTGIDPDGEHFEGSASHYCPICKATGRIPANA